MATATTEELEKFRRQWQEEVKSRKKGQSSVTSSKTTATEQTSTAGRSSRALPPKIPQGFLQETQDDGEHGYHDVEDEDPGRKLGDTNSEGQARPKHEPSSALEHYEQAVEREAQGNLGDSLKHYRQAYRLDAAVDKAYKSKHFPNPPSTVSKPASSTPSDAPTDAPKPTSPNPSNAPVTVPNPAHHSLTDAPPGTISKLIASFAALSIPGLDPPTDASPAPPSPLSTLPPELLTQILHHLALSDPSSFARTSLVCKHLAYLVATEDRIWQNICVSHEHGLAGMHYNWVCSIVGNPLPQSISSFDLHNHPKHPRQTLPLTPTYPTYKRMYQTRPRLRFSGCYISTVNYHRPGAATASQATWSSPVLIVTYYRYLRFYRDGTCISLLTTAEPGEVVHQLVKDNLGRAFAQGAPGAVMNHGVRGRWRLSGDPFDEQDSARTEEWVEHDRQPVVDRKEEKEQEMEKKKDKEKKEEEGVLHIETEGADAATPNPKYVYKMMLGLQSTGGGRAGKTRNNKLAWLGYWSYNKLSDDWAEFGLKNDKPFFWSRVKSYGDGE